MFLNEAVPTRVAKLALDPVVQHIDGTFKHLSDDVLTGLTFQSAISEFVTTHGVRFDHPKDVVAAVRLLRSRRLEEAQRHVQVSPQTRSA